MKISDNGISSLTKYEKPMSKLYPDEAGLMTIGIGHLCSKEEIVKYKTKTLTQSEMVELLRKDLIQFEKAVNSVKCKTPLNQNQYDALVIFSFNIGVGGFLSSSTVKSLILGDYKSVPTNMMKWNKVKINGVLTVSKGLTNRRQFEINLWNKEV